jgi:hypothetical protein
VSPPTPSGATSRSSSTRSSPPGCRRGRSGPSAA